MKKLFLLLSLSSSLILFAQEDSDVSIHSNTIMPIRYAKVTFEGKTYYKNTDEKGRLKLDKGEKISKISATGFEDFFPENNQKEYTLTAKKSIESKGDLPKNKIKTTIGKLYKKTDLYRGATDAVSTQVQYLPYKNDYPETAFIRSISFLSFFSTKAKKQPIILRLYKNDNGQPGELYGTTDLVVECKPGKSINKVDLSKSNIILPKEGLFIGLEWINIPATVLKYDYIKNIDGSSSKSKQSILNLGVAYESTDEDNNFWILSSDGWKKSKPLSKLSKINFEIIISD
ncbi:hypothetical protein J2X97_002311 [Epilithonimonas hungarica]|uniref:hypothetical protein n=1 Tax=Epilithonimonas hungarica TaxID=454006 RepID=UPI00277FB438|nr:hypothetical protein [Epilithonimonas hungarica]MDP9956652.1 hypothetical protein [Epilithonimonas hungarica]